MGGKKKKAAPAKKAKGPASDVDDISMENFWKLYKKKCVEIGCEVSKNVKKKFECFLEDNDDKMRTLHMWEEIGWPGTLAITDSLK